MTALPGPSPPRTCGLWVPFLCTALLTVLSHVAHAADSANGWSVLHKQTPEATGSSTQPSIRYGHTCAAYQGRLVASHGYYYDRHSNNVNWLSDTWTMSMKPPHKWEVTSPGITQEAALAAYQAGKRPPAPCGRFGHAHTLLNHTMYMYGGHDGGYSRHGRENYEAGHDFEELWSFDFETKRWSFVEPNGTHSPGQRYLAAMTGLHEELVLYGGMAAGQGDVWAFNVTDGTWQLLAQESRGEEGPGRRVGHSLTPAYFPHGVAKGVILFGGREVHDDGSSTLAEGVWFFDLEQLMWRRLTVDSPSQPSPRAYHAEAHTYIPMDKDVAGLNHAVGVLVGLVIGGTTTTPQLTCANETWAFVVDCGVTAITWRRLPDLPVPLYDARAAADTSAVYVSGGHLCAAAEGFPFFYTNQARETLVESS